MSNNIDSNAIQIQLINQFQIHLSNADIEELGFLIHEGKIQKAVNLLSKEGLEISEVKSVLDFVKNLKNDIIHGNQHNTEIIIDNQTEKEQSTLINTTDIKPKTHFKESTNSILKLFNFQKIKSLIFKLKTQESSTSIKELTKNEGIDNFQLFINAAIQSFIDKERDHCTINISKNQYFELNFFNKKVIVIFKKIKSAHLQNKDISRIQLSGNYKIPSGYLFIPVGVDLINEVFVFWNPNGFVERFEHNKNTSFYSSFEKQSQAKVSGIIEHKLSNETIYISNSDNFHNQLILRITSFYEIDLTKPISKSPIYTIDKKYCDKLNNKNISDQISNWLSTEDEKSNNKNPFNNYRGIRTLEFQTRNEIPAFFLFITTLSKRKDDNANIWTDKYNNETGQLTYHGDAKPGRELYSSQNHGNCRLKKVNQIAQIHGFIPPVIYFVKTAKGEMEFKGIFKIAKIEEFDDVANGHVFRNLKILSNRDLGITNIKPSEIVSIRVLGINNLISQEWYIRNCTKI